MAQRLLLGLDVNGFDARVGVAYPHLVLAAPLHCGGKIVLHRQSKYAAQQEQADLNCKHQFERTHQSGLQVPPQWKYYDDTQGHMQAAPGFDSIECHQPVLQSLGRIREVALSNFTENHKSRLRTLYQPITMNAVSEIVPDQ